MDKISPRWIFRLKQFKTVQKTQRPQIKATTKDYNDVIDVKNENIPIQKILHNPQSKTMRRPKQEPYNNLYEFQNINIAPESKPKKKEIIKRDKVTTKKESPKIKNEEPKIKKKKQKIIMKYITQLNSRTIMMIKTYHIMKRGNGLMIILRNT